MCVCEENRWDSQRNPRATEIWNDLANVRLGLRRLSRVFAIRDHFELWRKVLSLLRRVFPVFRERSPVGELWMGQRDRHRRMYGDKLQSGICVCEENRWDSQRNPRASEIRNDLANVRLGLRRLSRVFAILDNFDF